jgi:hypothetical protein
VPKKKYTLPLASLLEEAKQNLCLQHGEDDAFLEALLLQALDYAAEYQKKGAGHYGKHPVPLSTRRAAVMLASHWYESRDGSTGGFFADSPAAARQADEAVHSLLRQNKDWRF